MVVLLVLALIAVAVVMGFTAWRLRRTRERRRLLAAFTVCQIVAFLLVVALIVW